MFRHVACCWGVSVSVAKGLEASRGRHISRLARPQLPGCTQPDATRSRKSQAPCATSRTAGNASRRALRVAHLSPRWQSRREPRRQNSASLLPLRTRCAATHLACPLSPSQTMAARPLVTLADCDESVPLPAVFTAPIRPDIVQITHTNMAKNKRQARDTSPWAASRRTAPQTAARGSLLHPLTLPLHHSSPGIRCLRQGWPPDGCRVVGHRARRVPYPPCARGRHAPLWPGRLRQHVPRWRHVLPYQGAPPSVLHPEPCVRWLVGGGRRVRGRQSSSPPRVLAGPEYPLLRSLTLSTSPVRPGLAPVAPQDQHQAEALRGGQRAGCLCAAQPGDGSRPQDRRRPGGALGGL